MPTEANARAYELSKAEIARLRALKTADLQSWIKACSETPDAVRSALLKNYNRSRDDIFLNVSAGVREDLKGVTLPGPVLVAIQAAADNDFHLSSIPDVQIHTLVERDERLFATWSLELDSSFSATSLRAGADQIGGIRVEDGRYREDDDSPFSVTGLGEIDPVLKRLTIIPATSFYEPALIQVANLLHIAKNAELADWKGTPADGFNSEFDRPLAEALDEQAKLMQRFLQQPIELSEAEEAELDHLGDVIAMNAEAATALRAQVSDLQARLQSAEGKMREAQRRAFSIKTDLSHSQIYYSCAKDDFFLAKIWSQKNEPPHIAFFVYDKEAAKFSDLVKVTDRNEVASLIMERREGGLILVPKDTDVEAFRKAYAQSYPGA